MNTEPQKLFLFENAEELDESKVVSIAALSKLKLEIPEYQRPYTWSADSVNVLFNDIKEALENKKEEYRLGSVILCKGKDNDAGKYLIVDGQQRLTTLTILLYCLDKEDHFGLLETTYSGLSKSSIQTNYAILQGRTDPLKEKDQFRNYILNNCSVVKIVTDNEQAAFQFFDSQNSRGKALDPHDLLKAYHLREVGKNTRRGQIIELVREWEEQNKEDNFGILFGSYLYPIVRWLQGKDGLNYSSKDIRTFKGIAPDKITKLGYSYAVYHEASNLFIERFNQANTLTYGSILDRLGRAHRTKAYVRGRGQAKKSLTKLIASSDRSYHWEKWKDESDFVKRLKEFQLNQPIVAGLRFFEFTLYYQNLLKRVKDKVEEYHTDKEELEIPGRPGDKYVRQLYECVLLALADRFGEKVLTEETMNLAYQWCYTLRLVMFSLYPKTVNNYALGRHNDRVTKDIPLFRVISEMESIGDLVKEINIGNVPPATKKNIYSGNEKRYKSVFRRLSRENENPD